MRFMGWTQGLCAVTLLLALHMACAADEDAALMPSAVTFLSRFQQIVKVDVSRTLADYPGSLSKDETNAPIARYNVA